MLSTVTASTTRFLKEDRVGHSRKIEGHSGKMEMQRSQVSGYSWQQNKK